ncbi:hypothetical protein KCU85_g263, partial [Aureobasidium melanogenum]
MRRTFIRRPVSKLSSANPRIETDQHDFFCALLCISWLHDLGELIAYLHGVFLGALIALLCSIRVSLRFMSSACSAEVMQQARSSRRWSICSGPFCRARSGYSHDALPLLVHRNRETGREEVKGSKTSRSRCSA